jgi:hypothetical protein
MIQVASWRDSNLINQKTLESKVTNIFKETKSSVVRINNNPKYDLSLVEQPVIKRGNEYMLPEAANLEIGDEIFNYDNPSDPIVVESLDLVEKDTDVFLFYREPWGLLVAGSMLAYNGCETYSEIDPNDVDPHIAENPHNEEESDAEFQDN